MIGTVPPLGLSRIQLHVLHEEVFVEIVLDISVLLEVLDCVFDVFILHLSDSL